MHYKENWEGRTGLDFGIDGLLFEGKSAFQEIRIYQTDIFGRLMTLDDLVMVTEADEFVYHEMIVHPALFTHPAPKRVLVIGGGDGGTIREVLRHAAIERVDLVEIDSMVVEASRKYLPSIAASLSDPRLSLKIEDGVAFVRNAPDEEYDLVVVDSTDPGGIADGLFNESFFREVARILTSNGMVVSQNGESPFDCDFPETIAMITGTLRNIFPILEVYTAAIPTYAYGLWSFSIGSKSLRPSADYSVAAARKRITQMERPLLYYTPGIHLAAFALPAFMERLVHTVPSVERLTV